MFVFRRKKKTASFKFLEGFYEIHKLLNLIFGRKQFLSFLLFIYKMRKMKKNIKFKAAPTTLLILASQLFTMGPTKLWPRKTTNKLIFKFNININTHKIT